MFCPPGLPQLKNFATSMLVRGHNHARLVRRLHADNFEQKFIAWTDSGDDADCWRSIFYQLIKNNKRMIEMNDLQTPFAYVHLVHRSIHWNHVKHTANVKYYQNYTVHFTQF